MKKIYTMIMAMTMAMTVSAQGQWTKTIEALTGSAPYYSAPVLTTADKGVTVAGRFDQTLLFGESVAENIATSTYVAKYDAQGNELWMTAVQGAANIKAMAEDADGNIVVAGTFGDDIKVGDITLEGGYNMFFDKIQSLSNSFIAVLGADGSVKAAKAYAPSANSSFWGIEGFMDEVCYFSEPSFVITSLSIDGGKIVASGLLKGEMYLGGEGLSGGTVLSYGWLLDDLATAIVFTTDAALEGESVVAKMTATEAVNELAAQPWSLQTTAANGKIYLASVITGKQTLTVGGETKDFALTLAEGVDTEYGVLLAVIADGSLTTKCYAKASDIITPYDLNAITVDAATLYVGGSFKGTNPVNNALKAAGQSDLFIIKADADLNAKAMAVAYEEDGENAREVATALIAADGTATLYGYVADKNSEPTSGLRLTAKDNENSLCSLPVVVTGADGLATAAYNIGGEGFTQTVSTEAVESTPLAGNDDAVESISANGTQPSAIYDLQGRRTHHTATGLYIIGGQKAILK